MGYEYLDISGDAGVRATGKSIEEVFGNAAVGMYGLVTNLEKIRGIKTITVEAESQSPDGLLVAWLNELIFRLDTDGFIGRKVNIVELKSNTVRAEVTGEQFDPAKHEGRLLLKAATYHDLKLEERNGEWVAEVIFDI